MRLAIWSEPENIDQLSWAMQSLKDAMKWDEEVYGLEYDLDVYHVIAVSDFNMGAMENKGLNVFNTACVLAKPSTATDSGGCTSAHSTQADTCASGRPKHVYCLRM